MGLKMSKIEDILPGIGQGRRFCLNSEDGITGYLKTDALIEVSDLLGDGWKLEPIKVAISREDLMTALEDCGKDNLTYNGPGNTIYFNALCRKLGL